MLHRVAHFPAIAAPVSPWQEVYQHTGRTGKERLGQPVFPSGKSEK